MTISQTLNITSVIENVEFFKATREVKTSTLAVIEIPKFSAEEIGNLNAVGVTNIWFLGEVPNNFDAFKGLNCFDKNNAIDNVEATDLIIAYDPRYWDIYQFIGMNFKLQRKIQEIDVPIIPYSAKADKYPMLPLEALNGGDLKAIRYDDVIYQYLSRNGLKGSFAEFGTYFGRSFYKAYMLLNEQFKGDFWSFDSFGGLPPTKKEEAEYSAGDFVEGRYFCNEGSFRAIGEMTFKGDKAIKDRVKVVKGFYDKSLDGHTIADYGIAEKSISYCSIDCDLFDSTLSVLRFIGPALEDGAVIYLDDYRMARAAKDVSLYGAVKVWLSENPSFELLDLHRDHWQHQYVIFNRY